MLCAAQEQRQELVQGPLRLLEPANLPAAKALVALALLCKADCSLLGLVVQPQLLQQACPSMKHFPQALCWTVVCTVIILHVSNSCVHACHQVARINAAGSQAVDTALTALRQQICKAMERITNQVLPLTRTRALHLCTVLKEILSTLLGKSPQLENILI